MIERNDLPVPSLLPFSDGYSQMVRYLCFAVLVNWMIRTSEAIQRWWREEDSFIVPAVIVYSYAGTEFFQSGHSFGEWREKSTLSSRIGFLALWNAWIWAQMSRVKLSIIKRTTRRYFKYDDQVVFDKILPFGIVRLERVNQINYFLLNDKETPNRSEITMKRVHIAWDRRLSWTWRLWDTTRTVDLALLFDWSVPAMASCLLRSESIAVDGLGYLCSCNCE